MNGLTLEYKCNILTQHIIRARIFFDLWLYFEEIKSRKKIIRTMNKYPSYFIYSIHSYFVSYTIYISGVFDNNRRTISFKSLINEMRSNYILNRDEFDSINRLLDEAGPVVGKIKILRNKAFAHRTAHESYNDVFKAASVKSDELLYITDVALDIANKMRQHIGLRNENFYDPPRLFAEKMMNDLAFRPELGGDNNEGCDNS